jgi:hypothetical protein
LSPRGAGSHRWKERAMSIVAEKKLLTAEFKFRRFEGGFQAGRPRKILAERMDVRCEFGVVS